MKYIYHHLGLGDHITCHGIVRHYCENEDKVFLFVKPNNYNNVSRMFKDITNIEFILGDDYFVQKYIQDNNISEVLKIGFILNDHENFEYQFYNMAQVPIEYKHSKFYIERDYDKEIELFNSLGLKKNDYIFVHDGGWELRTQYFDENMRIVKPEGYGLFDWMYVIENAKEIHCIDSSFICLIDCMNLENKPLYNHRYVRNYPEYIKLYTHKKWKIIQ